MKIFILLLAILFAACAGNNSPKKQTDREREGINGKAANMSVSMVFPMKGKCSLKSVSYDEGGSMTRQKVYTNDCGAQSMTTTYNIAADGTRIATLEGTEQIKNTFTFDQNGRLSEEITAGNKMEAVQVKYFYDENGRLKEKTYSTNGTQYGKDVFEYNGDQKVPSKFVYSDTKANKSLTVTYTNYEFNSQGDWIKREESDNGRVTFIERSIEYYKD